MKIIWNPGQYDNLNIFIDEQNLMREMISKSILPVYELDVSDNNINTAVEKIAAWLESNGGLYTK